MEQSQKFGGEKNFLRYYLTDAKNFQGSLNYVDNENNILLLSEDVEDRNTSQYQIMPQEEIEAAQEKVRQELPYIRALEEVDQLKQKYESNNKIAALTYKFMESIKEFSQNLKDRFSSKDNLMLEAPDMLIQQKNEGMYEQSKDKEETKREKFLNELSNNGQYREQVENTMLMQDQNKKEVLETKDIER